MNREILPPAGRDDFDSPPDRELAALFAATAPPPRPVDVALLLPMVTGSKSVRRNKVSSNHFLERVKNMIRTHKRLSAATAAGMALAVGSALYLSLGWVPAYAMEQTARANDHISSYHVKVIPPLAEGRGKGVGEVWVQLNPDGTLLRARVDRLTNSADDRITFGSMERIDFWHRARNLHVICRDKETIQRGFDEFMKARSFFDPKLAFEQLQAEEKAGKLRVTTKEPVRKGEPVVLTVTFPAQPDRRQTYEIDPQSKLVGRVIDYRGGDGRWEQVRERDYLDYNKEIDPKVFRPELPKDVLTMDQGKVEPGMLGLAKGELTEDQIATKLAKECFESLIAGDYQTASRLSYGVGGEEFKELFARQKIKFLRIVEIGKPFHDPRSAGKFLKVPVKVQLERHGEKTVEDSPLTVGPVPGKPGRWSVCGGL
jgi:hypothetical protein